MPRRVATRPLRRGTVVPPRRGRKIGGAGGDVFLRSASSKRFSVTASGGGPAATGATTAPRTRPPGARQPSETEGTRPTDEPGQGSRARSSSTRKGPSPALPPPAPPTSGGGRAAGSAPRTAFRPRRRTAPTPTAAPATSPPTAPPRGRPGPHPKAPVR